MADTTLLLIEGGTGSVIPPYAARGLTQTLEPIAGAAQRRTLNSPASRYRGSPDRAAGEAGVVCFAKYQVSWIITLSMDSLMPSQNKNARAIDADSAPSKPHSSFVGSRFCRDADIPSLMAPGKSAMTLSFQVV